MFRRTFRLTCAVVCALSCGWLPGATLDAQNGSPSQPSPPGNRGPERPGPPGTRAGNQSASGPTNQTPARPAEPPPIPGTPLYISPGVVQVIQQKLLALGHPVPTVSGAWGDNSARALAEFQQKNGLDPGGDLDERTLAALGMAQVLAGELPTGATGPVSAAALATGGAPVAASPRLARVIQHKMTDAGFPTHNVFGIFMVTDNAPRAFQKARGLDVTGTLDLRMVHTLGLTEALVSPPPGRLPSDAIVSVLVDSALLFTGAPLTLSPTGLRQVQTALQQQGFKEVTVDGRWSDALAAALKKYQEVQKLDVTGSLSLQTLRALGFTRPLVDLDQAPVAAKTTK